MVEMNSKVMLDISAPSTDCALIPYSKRTSTRTNNKALLNIELPYDLEPEIYSIVDAMYYINRDTFHYNISHRRNIRTY